MAQHIPCVSSGGIAVLMKEFIRNMFKFDPVSNALRPSEVKMKNGKIG